MNEELYDNLMKKHWLFRVVPARLWSVKCNGTCNDEDPHTHHLSPVWHWMVRIANR